MSGEWEARAPPPPTHGLWVRQGWFPCSDLGPGPRLPFAQHQAQELERPAEASLLSGGPGSQLVGSPCWPKATWVLRCSAQPHSLGPQLPR